MKRMIPFALAIAVVGYAQDPKPASAPMILEARADKAEYALNDDIQVEVTLKNTTQADHEITEFVFDERSIELDVTLPGNNNFTYSRLAGGPRIADRLPLERQTLRAGGSITTLITLPTLMVGDWVVKPKYHLSATDVLQAQEIKIKVKEAAGKQSQLAAAVTFLIDKDKKSVMIDLWPDKAPNSVANFVNIAKRKVANDPTKRFYNDLKVFRVVKSGWLQTGCPYDDGFGGPGFTYRSEADTQKDKKLEFDIGTVALSQVDKVGPGGTQGSQFFICTSRTVYLDGKYTVIGKVNLDMGEATKGREVIQDIMKKAQPERDTERPTKDIRLVSLEIVTK